MPGAVMTVCAKCSDTHQVWSVGSERMNPCLSCPSPCPRCVGADGMYCKTTPCSCDCHTETEKPTVVGEEYDDEDQ